MSINTTKWREKKSFELKLISSEPDRQIELNLSGTDLYQIMYILEIVPSFPIVFAALHLIGTLVHYIQKGQVLFFVWFSGFWICLVISLLMMTLGSQTQSNTQPCHYHIQCVPEKRKPINQVNFSENYNELSNIVYIVTKLILSPFFWHQIQDVLAMYGWARTIWNGDVKIDLRRIGG